MKLGAWLMMLTAMIMFLTFMGLPTGLNSTLDSLGITIDDGTAQLQSADVESASFWNRLFNSTTGILVLLSLGGAVVIGLFARSYDTSLVILPFVIFVAGLFITTFWSVIKYVDTFNQWWMTSIIALIFSSLAIGFIMANVDYFAGR